MNETMTDATGTTDEMAGRLLGVCRRRGLHLATCESITGGGIGWAVTAVPGASRIFRGGLITYASELKATLAGVDAEAIARNGVVNEATALAMADGAARACGAEVAVSVTGTAGPLGQDGVAPGTVWVGVHTPDGTRAHRLALEGGRAAIREETVRQALRLTLEALI